MGSLGGNYTATQNFMDIQEGEFKVLNSANPASNNEIVYTVPAKTGFMLYGFASFFTTSATVGNRLPGLQVEDDNFDIIARFASGAPQAASLATILWSWAANAPVVNAAIIGGTGAGCAAMGIPLLYLPAGYILRTNTQGMVAGDDWTAASIYGLEYRQP